MKTSFVKASIWAVIWRFIIASFLFSFFLTILEIVGLTIPLTWAGLISSLATYLLIYLVTKHVLTIKRFSWDAIIGNTVIDYKLLGKLALMTIPVVIAAATFLYFFLLIVVQFDWLTQLLTPYFELIFLSDVGVSQITLLVIAVIAAPLVEELFFRGYILNKWGEKYKATSAVFWSSFVFMIIHIPSLFIPQLLIGLFCAIVYMKTKKLIYPILVHAWYNFLVMLPSLLFPSEATGEEMITEVQALLNPDAATMQQYFLGAGVFIVALTVLYFIFKNYGKNMKEETTPYVENIYSAPDFIDYQKNREPTEEETIDQWAKGQNYDPSEDTTNQDRKEKDRWK